MKLTPAELEAMITLANHNKIVFVNEGCGVGILYLNGKKVRGLVDVDIHSETSRDNVTFPKVSIGVSCHSFDAE